MTVVGTYTVLTHTTQKDESEFYKYNLNLACIYEDFMWYISLMFLKQALVKEREKLNVHSVYDLVMCMKHRNIFPLKSKSMFTLYKSFLLDF